MYFAHLSLTSGSSGWSDEVRKAFFWAGFSEVGRPERKRRREVRKSGERTEE